MKKVIAIIMLVFLSLLISGCKDNISLKGDDSIIIELGSVYTDEGILISPVSGRKFSTGCLADMHTGT